MQSEVLGRGVAYFHLNWRLKMVRVWEVLLMWAELLADEGNEGGGGGAGGGGG